MSELRKLNLEEIESVFSYRPNIPDNWYVPAQQVWTYLAWCVKQIMEDKRFRNDKDANKCMNQFENWIEERAVAFGRENKNDED